MRQSTHSERILAQQYNISKGNLRKYQKMRGMNSYDIMILGLDLQAPGEIVGQKFGHGEANHLIS